LHNHAFAGNGGGIALPSGGGERGKRKERVGNREEEGREGREGVGMDGKGERSMEQKGQLDIDICPGAPEFLVTPLHECAQILLVLTGHVDGTYE